MENEARDKIYKNHALAEEEGKDGMQGSVFAKDTPDQPQEMTNAELIRASKAFKEELDKLRKDRPRLTARGLCRFLEHTLFLAAEDSYKESVEAEAADQNQEQPEGSDAEDAPQTVIKLPF